MWLRDSTNQLLSYASLLESSGRDDSLASLYRGVINLQARYLLTSPYCQAFQPPLESEIITGSGHDDNVRPAYEDDKVFECKFELDSLAAFLSLSTAYYQATKDAAFFGKFQWVPAVRATLKVAREMAVPTYAPDGTVNRSPYTFGRGGGPNTDTLANGGVGNPVAGGTGLIRSGFRPSDDACIYQLFVPANAMFSHSLVGASAIMRAIRGQSDLAEEMTSMAAGIRTGVSKVGQVDHPRYGRIYAYEVDGFGSQNLMDDANVPSLLSLPLLGYTAANDTVYQATRRFIFSSSNPYMSRGSALNGIGGPHNGPGKPWPMASIVRILTSSDDTEIFNSLKELVSSTNRLGLIHESMQASKASSYTRSWFAWANGLFGQMIIDLAKRKPELLARSFQ